MHRIPQAGRLVNIPLARRLSPPSRAVHTRHELYSSIIFDEQAASTFRISTCHCSPPPNRGFLRWLGCSEGASSYEKIVTSRVWSTGVTRSSFLLPPAGQQSVLAIVSSSQAEVPQDLLSLPKLIVPFSALTDLVPFTVLYDTLPFLKFTLAEFPAAPRAAPDAIPRWDTWLEQWYQMFHPATWTCLEQDNQADVNKIDEISPLLVAAAKGPEGIKGKRAQELATLLELLYKRCTSRFIALYALHVTRKTYFERKKVQLLALRTALGETATATELEGDILRDLERADEGAAMLPPFEPGSVWPFTTPAPIPHSAHDPPAPNSHEISRRAPYTS
ncbi:hypothetical protein JCM11251_004431 [Rhodosporidiobolus azoricus]